MFSLNEKIHFLIAANIRTTQNLFVEVKFFTIDEDDFMFIKLDFLRPVRVENTNTAASVVENRFFEVIKNTF